MDRKYKVGGYVKLAKLWERSKDVAVAYHSSYYAERFRDDVDKRLVGVYIDITGNKEIYKRPEMVHLLKDCKKGAVNLIFSQTRAYLAANTCDFCFLLKYLFDIVSFCILIAAVYQVFVVFLILWIDNFRDFIHHVTVPLKKTALNGLFKNSSTIFHVILWFFIVSLKYGIVHTNAS